jgi:ATP-dependent Clp protease ATP-binding subunit ClpC
MFEFYTERARRVIFFARYEASNYGSNTIETEHLLLGLCREDRKLLRYFDASERDIRVKVEALITKKTKVSTSIDLPLSNECKRILAYANEEAERLGHRHIGTEHLLLGMLRESGCLAARVLGEAGVRLESLRDELAKSKSMVEGGGSDPDHLPPADRSSVHALVDQLPESALGRAHWMLEQLL